MSKTTPADEITSCFYVKTMGSCFRIKPAYRTVGNCHIKITKIEVKTANHSGQSSCGFKKRKHDARLRGRECGAGLRSGRLLAGLPSAGPRLAELCGLLLLPQPEGAAGSSAVPAGAAAAAGWQRTAGPSAGEGLARALSGHGHAGTARRSRPAEIFPSR